MATLPIDYRSRPWRDKYLFDETPMFNDWFIFGEYPDGSVGISDGDRDILSYVPRDVAVEIVAARRTFTGVIGRFLARSYVSPARGADHTDV